MSIKWIGESSQNNPNISERLIARYVHSGNSIVQASSVDPTTGIFTTTQSMSWTANTIYNDIVVSYIGGIPSKLFSEWNGINAYGLKVIDANTFYIVNGSSSNTVVTYATGQTVDLTKIQFEYVAIAPPSIDLTKVTTGDKLKIVWKGIKNRGGYIVATPNWSYTGGTGGQTQNAIDGRCFQFALLEIICEYNRDMQMLYFYEGRAITQSWSGGTTWGLSSAMGSERTMSILPNLAFTRVTLGNMSNNTTVEVYGTY